MATETEFTPSAFEKYTFAWYEFIVFVLVLGASVAIGIFYGFFGNKNKTSEDFLMAGRSMGIFPVTLSLFCSFISSTSMMGVPGEVYFYGISYIYVCFGLVLMSLALFYIYVPVYFDLQLGSAYEYFEWRFSRYVRVLMSILAMIQLMLYMPTVIWGPSLVFQEVVGVDAKSCAAAIFISCIVYSAVGGLKAVLWTDALQAVFMGASIFGIFFLGVHEVGGFQKVWETSQDAQRLSVVAFDVDPRIRHTLLTSVIGGYFMFLQIFGATQAQIQRYNSVPTLKKSKQCLMYNMVALVMFQFFGCLIGLVIFTKYASCDPIASKRITSSDQLLPLFVMEVLGGYPGLPGLVVAGLTSGALSTVSSALNAAAAIIIEDFVKRLSPGLSENQLFLGSKIISLTAGLIAFGFLFVVAAVNNTVPLQPFTIIVMSVLYAPILGAYTLGMIFPWVDYIGASCGIITSMILMGIIVTGNVIGGMKGLGFNQKLPVSIEGCSSSNSTILPSPNFSTFTGENIFLGWRNDESSFGRDVWNISFMWQPVIGTLTTIGVGLVVSFVASWIRAGTKRTRVNHSLLSKPFLKFWVFLFGKPYMSKWVDFDSPSCAKSTSLKITRDSDINQPDFDTSQKTSALT